MFRNPVLRWGVRPWRSRASGWLDPDHGCAFPPPLANIEIVAWVRDAFRIRRRDFHPRAPLAAPRGAVVPVRVADASFRPRRATPRGHLFRRLRRHGGRPRKRARPPRSPGGRALHQRCAVRVPGGASRCRPWPPAHLHSGSPGCFRHGRGAGGFSGLSAAFAPRPPLRGPPLGAVVRRFLGDRASGLSGSSCAR